jgi:hypothetical protein
VADLRIHGTTKRQVREAFEQSERGALLALPAGRFELFQEAQRCVHRDGHVEVKRAYYSVPPEFVGQRVWVRFDGRVVRIFDLKMQQIALHVQSEPGRFSTHAPHIAAEKRSNVERGAAWLIEQAGRLGPHARAWAEAMIQERGVEAMRALVGLNSLGQRYPARQIDQACQIAHGHGAWRLRVVRELLERRQPPQEQGQLPFISEHPIIRPLSDYTQLIREAFTQ